MIRAMKTCITCGKQLPSHRQKTCDERCFRIHRKTYALECQAKLVPRVAECRKSCTICSTEFTQPKGHSKIYCSKKCYFKVANAKRRAYSKKKNRDRYLRNRETIKRQTRDYYRANRKEMLKKAKERWLNGGREADKIRRSRPEVRKAIAEATRLRRRTDLHFRIRESVRSRVGSAIRMCRGASKKMNGTWKILCYSPADLKKHLESFFTKGNGFSWQNWGSVWEIDHVTPVSYFTFTSTADPVIAECWALHNLRPLRREENIAKQDRFAGVKTKYGEWELLLPLMSAKLAKRSRP